MIEKKTKWIVSIVKENGWSYFNDCPLYEVKIESFPEGFTTIMWTIGETLNESECDISPYNN